MSRIRNYIAWYKKLRSQGYNRLDSLRWAVYNSKYYTIEGTYK
jgi:hypothetical protein